MNELTQLPKRRWFQFRLRTILLLMLFVSVGLAWVMTERRRIAERREALKDRGEFFSDTAQPLWNRVLFGENAAGFANEFVAYYDFADADLDHLQGLIKLKQVSLQQTKITDTGL